MELVSAEEKHKAGDLAGAEDLYSKVIASKPGAEVAHTAYNNRGALRLQQRRFVEAVSDFEAAVALSSAADTWYNLGAALRNSGKPEAAVDAFDKALGLAPTLHACLCARSEALCALGRTDEALADARKAVALQPSDAKGYSALGFALVKTGDNAAAADAYGEAVARGDANAKQLLAISTSLVADSESKAGRHAAACALYVKALACAQPGSAPSMQYNYALTLLAAGQTDEALVELRGVLDTKPDHGEAHNALGVALVGRGDYAAALPSLEKAAKCAPDKVERLYNLGVAKLELGDKEDAVRIFRRVLERKPDYAPAKDALKSLQPAAPTNTGPRVQPKPPPPPPARKDPSVHRRPPNVLRVQPGRPQPPPSAAMSSSSSGTTQYVILPYDMLRAPGPYPDDVFVHEREMHLSDDDFLRLVGVTKVAFASQPKWKKDAKKRELKLF